MKMFFLLTAGVILLGSSEVYARAERKCTEEILTCRLEKQLMAGGKIFLQEKSEKFSGFNEDEPSIEPDECTVHLTMEKNEMNFNVKVGDSDYMASIYVLHDDNLGRVLPGAVSFPIIKGQTFYYLFDKLILSCSLK